MTEIAVPNAVAVVGAACRLPGADDVTQFWDLLRHGRDAVTREQSIDPTSGQLRMNARGVLNGIDMFDATFFGFSSADARIADPQIRLLLEEGFHAYEAAGRIGSPDRLGVFASCGMSTYLLNNVLADPQAAQDWTAVSSLNDKDFAATRLAYALDASGPAISVQTACSSSLVAVHLACESLLSGEIDTALVGGVGIHVPQLGPARTTPGALVAPDGHCRAFDASATGTVFGNGVVAVVLCRLEDARPTDDLMAVVLGTAVNNDGRRKAGYLSPSVDGQRDCIVAALDAASVLPDAVAMVEAHGTGTPVGDPIELQALREAWSAVGSTGRPCAIGSVKTNIGHTGEAAGLAGLLKALLSVRYGVIPPSLHFASGNPAFDWSGAPFYVPTDPVAWTDTERIAGVTSLGIGGTNAHVVVAATAPRAATPVRTDGPVVLRLSAASPASLAALGASVADALVREPSMLDATSDELNHRRKSLPYRAVVSGRSAGEVEPGLRRVAERRAAPRSAGVRCVFAFGGQGDVDTTGLGGLVHEPAFTAHLERSVARLPTDDRNWLADWPAGAVDGSLAGRTDLVQPLLYAYQTFVVDQLVSEGAIPSAVIGHSVGEIAAAYAAGMVTLPDGMRLAAVRGAVMQRHSPVGVMATVFAGREAIEGLVTDVVIAADNSADSCVLAGPHPAVDAAIEALATHGIRSRRLPVARAFHTPVMAPAADRIGRLASDLHLTAPRIPLISCLTGVAATEAELGAPGYWRAQALQPVRFRTAMRSANTALAGPQIWFDIGLKPSICHFVKSAAMPGVHGCLVADPARISGSGVSEILGQAWELGLDVPAPAPRAPGSVHVPIPYPFDRHRYWISPPPRGHADPDRAPARPAGVPAEGGRPRTDEILTAVLAAWRDGLGLDEIDQAADFFEVGGNSLAMIALVEHLERLFPARRLPRMRELLAVPTPQGMAEIIGRVMSDE